MPGSPRLLVALKERPELPGRVADRLPDVEWTYLAAAPADRLGAVEAMLLGSPSRELGAFGAIRTPRLRFVQSLYTGVDGVPFARFPAPIEVAGNVGGYAPFVSEHAVALLLAAARDLRGGHEQVATGRLRPPPAQYPMFGQTVVVLGYGAIGHEIALRMRPFGVRVVGVNRTGRSAAGVDAVYSADRLDEALAEGDAVVDVRPLTRSTVRSIGARQFASMRPRAVFVNVGRAGTVDEEALYRHLTAHPEFRAGIDVWWEEGFADGHLTTRFPFASLPNCVTTPHSAAFGSGADAYALDRALENLARYFRGGRPAHVIDRSEYEEPAA